MKQAGSSTNNRWWEFYGIRYAMGTVIGGVITYELFHRSMAVELPLLSVSGTITTGQLIIFAAYGLAYCYIASAPILVFHATRFVFLESKVYGYCKRRLKLIGLAFVVTTVVMVMTVVWSNHPPNHLGAHVLVVLASVEFLLPFSAFVFYQVLLIEKCLNARSTDIFDRYMKLAIRRNTDESGFVESYRHLREHGNSFAIVIMEIVLGLLLFLFTSLPILTNETNSSNSAVIFLLILLLWIMPAAMVWVFGLNLEKEFIDKAKFP